MIEYLIKYFFVFDTTFYLYFKFLNLNSNILYKKRLLCTLLLSIFSAAMITETAFPFYSVQIYLLFYLILMLCFHCEPKLCLMTSLITFTLSNAFLIISSIICGLLLYPFYYNDMVSPDIILFFLSGIIMYSISYLLFHIQLFKNGIKYLYNKNLINTITLVGIIIISSLTIGQYLYPSVSNSQLLPYVLLILLAAILLFFLWQRCIRQYYLTKLRNLELESLRQELAEKDAEINKLLANNERQARTIHRDNKLIPAMLSAVTEYLDSADESGSHAIYGRELSCRLKELADERAKNLTAENTSGDLPLLHRASVDAMLSYMKKRAAQEHIRFEVKIHPEFADRTTDSIAEADLSHLLSDLLENAIIAVKNAENRQILVHLGILYDVPAVEVSDSGSEFSPAIYQDLGLRKHSTHLGHGGSGIGLMDIWELKKKYAASLHIYEYAKDTAPFTKKISIVFDRKKHYLIRTYRPQELVKIQSRIDLCVLPPDRGKD